MKEIASGLTQTPPGGPNGVMIPMSVKGVQVYARVAEVTLSNRTNPSPVKSSVVVPVPAPVI